MSGWRGRGGTPRRGYFRWAGTGARGCAPLRHDRSRGDVTAWADGLREEPVRLGERFAQRSGAGAQADEIEQVPVRAVGGIGPLARRSRRGEPHEERTALGAVHIAGRPVAAHLATVGQIAAADLLGARGERGGGVGGVHRVDSKRRPQEAERERRVGVWIMGTALRKRNRPGTGRTRPLAGVERVGCCPETGRTSRPGCFGRGVHGTLAYGKRNGPVPRPGDGGDRPTGARTMRSKWEIVTQIGGSRIGHAVGGGGAVVRTGGLGRGRAVAVLAVGAGPGTGHGCPGRGGSRWRTGRIPRRPSPAPRLQRAGHVHQPPGPCVLLEHIDEPGLERDHPVPLVRSWRSPVFLSR